MPRLPALDGLRGIAIAGVLAFHAGALPGGYLGVDLFFVLSGFLITSLLLVEHRATGTLHLGRFWARRARRLLPAVLLLLLGIGAYAALLARPEELARLRGDALAALFYAANWRAILIGHDYWALFRAPSPLVHMWSLAIEEQLYLAWPPLVLLVLRLARGAARAVLLVAVALALASLVAMLALRAPGAPAARVYMGTDTRAAALLFGAALAAFRIGRTSAPAPRARLALEIAAAAAAVGLGVAWARGAQGDWLYGGGLFLCGLASATLLASAAHPRPGPIARGLSIAPLRWLGEISYGLYLWHWPVFVALTPARVGLSPPLLLVARLAAGLGLALASYHLVERPIRRGAFPGARMALLAPVAAAAVLGVVLASTAGAVAPPPAGLAPEAAAVAGAPAAPPAALAGEGRARLLVVGDSVGFYLGQALQRVGAGEGFAVESRGVVGCGLVRGSQRIRLPDGSISVRARCDDWEDRFRGDVARARPDIVLLVLGAPTLGDLDIDGDWLHPCMPAFDARYAQGVARAVEVLGAEGAAVLLATTPYVDLGEEYIVNRERTDCVNEVYRDAAADSPFAEIIDLGRHICPGRACRTHAGGAVLRPDGTHFQGEGADAVARWVFGAIRELPIRALRKNHRARAVPAGARPPG